jgi:MIP family channel proteins
MVDGNSFIHNFIIFLSPQVVPYMIAQTLGAFFSSFFVFGVYRDAIYNAGGMTNHTAGIFATYPAPYLTIAGGFFDQLFGTFILLIGIFAITDSKNSEVTSGLKPFMIGVVLWAIGSSFGMNAGYAVNPARDFGPRLFTAIVGWGPQVFVCDFCGVIRHWWWVPIVAPMVGGLFAAFFYWFFIEAHHPTQNRSLVISDDIDDMDVNDDDSINGEKKA